MIMLIEYRYVVVCNQTDVHRFMTEGIAICDENLQAHYQILSLVSPYTLCVGPYIHMYFLDIEAILKVSGLYIAHILYLYHK